MMQHTRVCQNHSSKTSILGTGCQTFWYWMTAVASMYNVAKQQQDWIGVWLVQSEAIIIGNMPSSSTRGSVLVILRTAAPSSLPIGPPRVWSIALLIPAVHNYSR